MSDTCLSAREPSTQSVPVGRLAPSPTGAQHVGNARTYLLAWLSIRSRGGKVILRIEDIDSPRVKQWAVDQALEDLKWLGLDWDEGPDVGGPSGAYLQTQRRDGYEQALGRLRAADRVYPCTCSRRDVAASASAPHAGQETPVYPGTCRSRSAQDVVACDHEKYAWRYRLLDAGERAITDGFAGPIRCDPPRELGDFVVGKSDGLPAYQLAVVVDDWQMGVTEVLRGDDLISSAFRQLELYEFFAWTPPQFVHVPLVVGEDGRRLAKRHGDTRLATFRKAGLVPQKLIGFLAWSAGLRPTAEPIEARQLIADFQLSKVPHTPFVFTDQLCRSLLTR